MRSGCTIRSARGKAGGGIRQTVRRGREIDADADHDRQAVGPLSASSRMPASLLPSASTSFGHLSCTSAPGAHKLHGFIEREAGDKAERRSDRRARRPCHQETARRNCPARRPFAPAPATPAGLQRGHDPERPALAGARARKASTIRGIEASKASSVCPASLAREPSAKAISQNSDLAAAVAASSKRRRINEEQEIEQAGDAQHRALLKRHRLEALHADRRNTSIFTISR